MGEIGHGNHHWGRLDVSFLPRLCRFQPVLSQKVVALADEIRERSMWLDFAIQVGLYFQVGVDVVELRLVLAVQLTVVSHHHTWCFHQSRLNCVIEPEVAHDPSEECLFAAFASRWCERCRRQVVARQDSPGAVNTVQSAHPFCGFFQFVFGKASNLYLRWYTPSVMGLVINDEKIL